MFVRTIYIDEWQSRRDNGINIPNPTWEMVRQAILQLDGDRKTSIALSDKEHGDHQMIIAGKWENRCMVNATTNNFDFFSLVEPNGPKKKKILFVAGQNGDYEERKCVPVEWALDAAQTFFETGELTKSLPW